MKHMRNDCLILGLVIALIAAFAAVSTGESKTQRDRVDFPMLAASLEKAAELVETRKLELSANEPVSIQPVRCPDTAKDDCYAVQLPLANHPRSFAPRSEKITVNPHTNFIKADAVR